MASRAIELRIALAAFAALAVLFVAQPQIDLAVSARFFADDGWLYARHTTLLEPLYRGVPRLGQGLLLLLTLGLLLGVVRRFAWLRARRATFGFLLAAALLGPVLVVDAGLKDHMGRARPLTVAEFGGARQFTAAFVPSGQCDKNCSFVSGHVATASFLMAFGWLGAPAVRRRWLAAGLAGGALLAFVRLSAGGHFLSDCVFAWFATYFSLWATEWVFRRLKWLP